MEYREIAPGELDRALFRHFERRQEVTKCRRRENGVWVVRDAPFIDDWSEADYAFLVQCLQNTLATGGVVLGAFADGALKGFASVESAPLGKAGDYRDLTCLHVSAELRGRGIGRELFTRACARRKKAVSVGPFGGGDTGVLRGDGLRGGPGVQ